MPKLRFEISAGAHLLKKGPVFPSLAIDTDRVVAYHVTEKRGDLHLWFQGVADSVIVTHAEIG